MEYIQDQFPYPPQPPQQQLFYHRGPYHHYLQHPQQLDDFYMTYGHPEYNDYVSHGQYQEEYEDMGDAPTRPRLTKDQVGILEAQFQANHKPNSMVKRQLAMQTNLSLPRVANWFQNRRAKAKQQKKQEEFENKQFHEGSQQDPQPDDESAAVKDDDELSEDEDFPQNQSTATDPDDLSKSSANEASKVAGWASLQRALNAAKVAQSTHQPRPQSQNINAMPPSDMHPESTLSTSHVGMRQCTSMQMPHRQSCSRKQSWADAWASHRVFQDQSFDFGFADQASSAAYSQPMVPNSQAQHFVQETCIVSPDSWQEGLPTPKGADHNQYEHSFQDPDLPLPAYPEARRGSGAESLTNNFDAFALANESPHARTTPVPAMDASQPDAHLDLAARRKRPRPAALTSASLRSRSYGAMTMSPTLRPGISPAHTVRHVKSTGHNLNARYSGVRKPTSAQRSPINFSTFAEAEAFDRLMTQQAVAAQATMADANGPQLSPAPMVHTQMPIDHAVNPMSQKFDLAKTYQLPTTQHLTLMTSPPTTPFTAEFDPYHTSFGMPPVSAPAQYASFPDCTPPYSAGPLTNSSWSDAPLTSPDLPNFPPVTYIPSLGHHQKSESMAGHFQEFILASDLKHEIDSMNSAPEQKKTDFFIQEFPNQKEEHAHVARQVAQHRPKNFVFANTAPSDYDQS